MSRCFRLFCCLRWLRLTPSSPGSGLVRRVETSIPDRVPPADFCFSSTVIFAALDVGRLHQSDSVPPSWQLAAIMVFAAALILQAAAMIVNPFFSPALRIQAEHGHSVITRGPYRFLRHPGYLAMLIAMPASAVAIGSWLALIPALAFSSARPAAVDPAPLVLNAPLRSVSQARGPGSGCPVAVSPHPAVGFLLPIARHPVRGRRRALNILTRRP